MSVLKNFVCALLITLLASCGGGGGSPGTNTTAGQGGGGSGAGTTGTQTVVISQNPTLELSIVDSTGAVVADNSISGGTRKVRAILKNAIGNPVFLGLITFSSGSAAVSSLSPASGQVLTDRNGVAEVLIQPASLNVASASTVSANATVGTVGVSSNINIQTSPSNVNLANFSPSNASLTAYQSTAVEVDVLVDSAPASAGLVSVNFSEGSACGTFSPATVSTNSAGKAISTFTSNGCSGSITLTASAQGAVANASARINVQSPAPNNIQFVSASPATIFSQQALFGLKQSTVRFRLVDANANGLGGRPIVLQLSNPAVAAGVVFTDTGSTTSNQSTDRDGFVEVNVRSGDSPTPVAVSAVLASNVLISATSGGLVVNSGAPAQTFFSLSASSFNIEGAQYGGELSTITIFAADRLAQPVPDGTVISFIAEGGQITASCQTAVNANGKSGCSVSLQSEEFRPANGRVSILVFAEGLESFIDTDGDNKFTSGESFADLGQPFLDSNENGSFDATEQKIGSASSTGIGSLACALPSAGFGVVRASVPNTCNGGHGRSLIRTGAVIAFSTSFSGPLILEAAPTRSGFRMIIQDQNGNAMPSESTVEAKVSGGVSCSLDGVFPSKVPSTPNPTRHAVALTAGNPGTCSGATVRVSVKTPKGNETLIDVISIP